VLIPTEASWDGTIAVDRGGYVIVDGGLNGGKPNYARGQLQIFGDARGGPAAHVRGKRFHELCSRRRRPARRRTHRV
jgi:hypothetical protein